MSDLSSRLAFWTCLLCTIPPDRDLPIRAVCRIRHINFWSLKMEFIDCKEQYRRYKTEIDDRMRAVLAHAQYVMGPEVFELEQALAKYVGVKHCLTASSGTHTLEIALRALDIGPGDEVITVPFTWISTAEVIALVGARPVFVDIEPDTFNINVDLLAGVGEYRLAAQTTTTLS